VGESRKSAAPRLKPALLLMYPAEGNVFKTKAPIQGVATSDCPYFTNTGIQVWRDCVQIVGDSVVTFGNHYCR
jgi:hypothetical protein